MEKNKSRIGNILRPLALAAAVIVGGVALEGCAGGQQSPPTQVEFDRDRSVFVLNDILAENGEPVRCVMYGRGSENTNYSKSWFGFSCDFVGTAVFPGEVAATTTTEG